MGKTQSREALTLHQQSSNITVPQLSEQLRDLVNWQPFAVFLEGITQPDIETIATNNPLNVVNQRIALFDLWLRRCPNPSWDHVIIALDKAREYTLAQRIREHVAECEETSEHKRYEPLPRHTGLSPLTVDEETVKQLTQLRDRFHKLLTNFCKELIHRLQTNTITLNELILQLKIEKATYNFRNVDDIKDIDKFFSVIQPHSTFLSCHLLVVLAEQFLDPNSEVLEGLRNHHENIEALKRNVKIEHLKNVIRKFTATKSVNETEIIVKAQNAWDKNELRAVEDFLETLFPFEHQKRLFRVEPGSVLIVYLVPHHITKSLITHSQHKKEFMRLTGIISLQVGDIFILQASEEKEHFTFEMGLMEAVETRNNEAVKFLLEHAHTNINIQTLDNRGLGTITDTEKEAEPETTENQLTRTKIQAGAVATGSSAAKKSKKEDSVDLYKMDSNRNILWHRDPVGTTPIMIACMNDDTDMIQLLLEHNANTNIQTRTGWTALMYTASLGNTRTVKLLLKHNAEVDTRKKSNGATALMYACYVGNVNTVTALLKHGADCRRKMVNGVTPLYIASQKGLLEVVKKLLQAKANPNTPMNNGATPLCIASQNGHAKVVELLLQANANPNAPMDNGTTPLYIASQNGHSEVVERLLLQAKANPNAPTNDGTTPLFIASQIGHSKVVGMLLEAKANPDIPRFDGATPLYIASQESHPEIVERLLQSKANPNTPRDNGATPLHPACQNGHLEIVKMLLQAKADPNYLMNNGRSPLDLASLNGHSNIVELLEHYY